MAARIYHWKHGWIPLDHYAALEKSHGRGGTADSLGHRIAGRDAANQIDAEGRVAALGELLPGELRPTPHRQSAVRHFEASGTIPAHHTGGVVFSRSQARALVRYAADNNEGLADPVDVGEAAGTRSRRQVGVGSHGAEAEAKTNARQLGQLLGLSPAPLPHIAGGQHTGGLQLDGPTADALIAKLQALHTGSTTDAEVRRASGLAPGSGPVGKDFRAMTAAQKVKAAEIMFGTGSRQHKAARARFKAS